MRKLLLLLLATLICSATGCGKKVEQPSAGTVRADSFEEKTGVSQEKQYDLPVGDSELERVESDCEQMTQMLSKLYGEADKGTASNVVLPEETIHQMAERIGETGVPVISVETYAAMENGEEFEKFLKDAESGKSGSAILYTVNYEGGIRRDQYDFDGEEMTVLDSGMAWGEDNQLKLTYVTKSKIREWTYSDQGWFCYELCVPEYPEVTEVVDGNCMIRVRPMEEKYRELSEKYVLPLGYQGNNLLCSNWDREHLSELDYNGLYEYLYAMKYGQKVDWEAYPDGIPEEQFEKVVTEYLPVTAEELQNYAVFNKETKTYAWAKLGCGNYAPGSFGISVPEVVGERENGDGTITLTVEAVCCMMATQEAVISHELVIQIEPDGQFRYLGNKIKEDDLKNIPDYQYRIKK